MALKRNHEENRSLFFLGGGSLKDTHGDPGHSVMLVGFHFDPVNEPLGTQVELGRGGGSFWKDVMVCGFKGKPPGKPKCILGGSRKNTDPW